MPDYDLERALCAPVAGVDEVGRGCIAGPVVAAAVILPTVPQAWYQDIADSKTLSARRRSHLAPLIHAAAITALAVVPVETIDRINILHASLLAMEKAVAALAVAPGHVLVDGNRLPPHLPVPATAVVGGDAKSLSIAAASIIAKVHRDHLMQELAIAHPGYGWETNAGYPTPAHTQALARLGVTSHHRRSFQPVKSVLL